MMKIKATTKWKERAKKDRLNRDIIKKNQISVLIALEENEKE